MDRDNWEVMIHGERSVGILEISVVKQSYKLGMNAYGWFGDKKIFIANSGGPSNDRSLPDIWGKVLKVAQEVCDELNSDESVKG